jgi:hypothetical protein
MEHGDGVLETRIRSTCGTCGFSFEHGLVGMMVQFIGTVDVQWGGGNV